MSKLHNTFVFPIAPGTKLILPNTFLLRYNGKTLGELNIVLLDNKKEFEISGIHKFINKEFKDSYELGNIQHKLNFREYRNNSYTVYHLLSLDFVDKY